MKASGDGDRHRGNLGVGQTKQAKKKKSRRPIDPEDIAGSISSAPERISHDTHLFSIPFGTPSLTGTSPQLSAMRLGDSSSEQSDAMASTPPLTQRFVHPDVSPSSTVVPSATPHDTMSALAPGQNDRLGRVMIKPDRSLSSQNARGSLKGGSLHTRGAKTVGTIAREMEKKLGRTPIEPEVFKKTHVMKKENESDSDVWVEERAERTFIWKEKVVGGTHKGRCYGLGSRNDVRRIQSGLEGIGSSRQAEALDGVQIAAMSDQIAKLTAALAESERRKVAEQESMSETVQQIKEEVMNLARRPTTSAPDDTDDESDEDDYVDLTP
ncbi:hypothetical protein MTR67_031721 [Solanum verrucosum]|uniref:Uncharacterized protein n=1 Tax=Solanum verrucosum TaxID=315347 RepID=A0AAF0U346_SOLVR|nr:hypothetical protein MTR67_031721 [Solanum verrucosum]